MCVGVVVGVLQSTPLLCKSSDSTYLSVLPSAATDMSGNPVLQIGTHHSFTGLDQTTDR